MHGGRKQISSGGGHISHTQTTSELMISQSEVKMSDVTKIPRRSAYAPVHVLRTTAKKEGVELLGQKVGPPPPPCSYPHGPCEYTTAHVMHNITKNGGKGTFCS